MIWKSSQRSLTKINSQIIVVLLVTGGLVGSCGQDYNSNSGDDGLAGAAPISADACATAEQARFCAARQLIQTHCFGCHATWKKYMSTDEWASAGLIVKSSSESSNLVRRMINAGGNMPLGGSALSVSDYDVIKQWINQAGAAGG